ncbi:aspartic peptidase domain-containing protein [Calycina marina]|uniref:Aspartic peptidase domain-containing protein n=1 Tax=Calycina marina TaxID=1763456 RepID=A0A9P7Z2M8_9HELO|nr:aspartic peptidase domain-containing protein [Calycina marina]
MLVFSILFVILALSQSAAAAYFFYPMWRCEDFNACEPSSKRAEVGRSSQREETISLRLVQRTPKSSAPHDVRIRQLADGLTKKYAARARSPRDLGPVPAESAEKRDASMLTAIGRIVRRVVPAGLPFGFIMHEKPKVSSRTNNYSIMEAATPSASNSAGINQDGTDYSYFAEVYLGTRTTPYQMLLDTGAGQTWIMGSTCKSDACLIHDTFGPSDSTTYEEVSEGFSIGYGTGTVSGSQVQDSITLAGLKLEMTFGVANTTSADFNNFPIDGILGLSRLTSDYPNFVQALSTSKLLKSNVFGVSLNRAADGANTGEINFGAPDTSRYSGSLGYTSVSSNAENDWAIPLDAVGIGATKTNVSATTAFLDTGTSFIFAPPDDVEAFHSGITGLTTDDHITYYVPCTTTQSVYLTFSGVTYEVSSKDWVAPEVNNKCASNIYGVAIVSDAWLLGDTFLKNVYAVFDVDESRVGLAQNKAETTSSTTKISSSSITTGGPKSSSISSTTLLRSDVADSSTTSPGPSSTVSNGISTGLTTNTVLSPSGVTSTVVHGSTTTGSPAQGLSGHQTSTPSASAAAAAATASVTSATSPSSTVAGSSLASRFDISFIATIVAGLTLLASTT